jgi:hypothetical protein
MAILLISIGALAEIFAFSIPETSPGSTTINFGMMFLRIMVCLVGNGLIISGAALAAGNAVSKKIDELKSLLKKEKSDLPAVG